MRICIVSLSATLLFIAHIMKTSSLVLALALALLLTVTTPALAVESKVKEMRQEIKDKKAELRKEVEVKRTEIKDTRQEARKNQAQATLKRLRLGIVQRFEAVSKSKAAIEARIAKIEAMVIPTGKSKRDLTAAKAKLATFDTSKYVADLAAFDAKQVEVLASTTPLKLTPELKALAKTLDADVKALRQTLADTLRLVIRAR